jgi:hypothetical protein
MSNTQKLSPQGYNIQDAPLNSNPFWDQEGGGGGGSDIEVDDALSLTSRNPVENKVITQALIETQESIPDVKPINERVATLEAEQTETAEKVQTHSTEINAIKDRMESIEDDIAQDKTRLTAVETGKQDKLTAGANISIIDNVISATGGGGGEGTTISARVTQLSNGARIDITDTASGSTSATVYNGEPGPAGAEGPQGPAGAPGTPGTTYTPIQGTTTTGEPGTAAVAVLTVDESAKTLKYDFKIPRGAKGDTGPAGEYTFDTEPTAGSTNPVTSGGIFEALEDTLQAALDGANEHTDNVAATKQNVLTFDPEPTRNSTNPATSGGIYNAIANAQQNAIDAGTAYTNERVNAKQDRLTAGDGISIINNVISATGGGLDVKHLGTISQDIEWTTSSSSILASLNNCDIPVNSFGVIVIQLSKIGSYIPRSYKPSPMFIIAQVASPQEITQAQRIQATSAAVRYSSGDKTITVSSFNISAVNYSLTNRQLNITLSAHLSELPTDPDVMTPTEIDVHFIRLW